MMKKNLRIKILLLTFFFNLSHILQARPPIIHVKILAVVGAAAGGLWGAYGFRDPEAYIDLLPLVCAPLFSILGSGLLPWSYYVLYSVIVDEKTTNIDLNISSRFCCQKPS